MGIFLGRAMAGLLEQRHIDHRGGVALRAGIAVPVPGAAEIAALLDDAHIVDAGLDQPRAGDEARKAAADKGEGHVVGLGLAGRERACTGLRDSARTCRRCGCIGHCRRPCRRLSRSARYLASKACLSIIGVCPIFWGAGGAQCRLASSVGPRGRSASPVRRPDSATAPLTLRLPRRAASRRWTLGPVRVRLLSSGDRTHESQCVFDRRRGGGFPGLCAGGRGRGPQDPELFRSHGRAHTAGRAAARLRGQEERAHSGVIAGTGFGRRLGPLSLSDGPAHGPGVGARRPRPRQGRGRPRSSSSGGMATRWSPNTKTRGSAPATSADEEDGDARILRDLAGVVGRVAAEDRDGGVLVDSPAS